MSFITTLTSDSNEWYTPPEYVEAARRVLGEIDLDPASCAFAQAYIKARRYYDIETDGLSQSWAIDGEPSRVWLNPPYGGYQAGFTARLLRQYQAGHVHSAILLVSAKATDARWFIPLWDHTLCFVRGRINFLSDQGPSRNTSLGSVFVYIGPSPDDFVREFKQYGPVVKRVDYAGDD